MTAQTLPPADRRLAHWLFGAAAAFNALVGLSLLFLRPRIAPLLHLDPITGTNRVLLYLTAGFILLFGYSYGLVASDPVRYRPFIPLAVIGKLVAFAVVTASWLTGQAFWTLPALASGDLVFAVLFALFLPRVPQRRD